ncbi:MAG: response regulator [Candidatus Omnitrophota bacterium]|nr:MAG: response regulator [Candidatus Omnitrophota bacterium]
MKKILIVEDEKETLDFLKDNLEREGFFIETAQDGRTALKKVGEFKPNLVILDIMLPELDGREVLAQIKENFPSIIVVLATAKKELEDIKEGYAKKADCYITKPYKLEEIRKVIEIFFSFEKGGN